MVWMRRLPKNNHSRGAGMEITESRYIELGKELHEVKLALDASLEEQRVAAALGDLRENEEYAIARANTERLLNRKSELEILLADATVVEADNSHVIGLGSKVRVKRVGSNSEPRVFKLETSGTTILDGVLGTESPLGKIILNGTDGVYTVHSNGGIDYSVEKVIER